jgi:hypothetical protein
MPPILTSSADTGKVEESSINGVPLWGLITFRYGKQDLVLGGGDVVFMMSDGFAETVQHKQRDPRLFGCVSKS